MWRALRTAFIGIMAVRGQENMVIEGSNAAQNDTIPLSGYKVATWQRSEVTRSYTVPSPLRKYLIVQ
jgi:hypothetical protein